MAKVQTVKVGGEIPGLTKTAYMPIDPQGRNPIHTDDFAREHGMRGALIGGSTLLSYVLEMLYNHFGQNWLYHGKIKVSFIGGGAVNGDVVTAHGRVTGVETEAGGTRVKLDVWLENQMGNKIVVGEASCLQ
jgi:acyl dehydratase